MKLMEQIKLLQEEEQLLEPQRTILPTTIKLQDMPEQSRYNKLKQESKMRMNIIKMICYRAETAVANELGETPHNQVCDR